MTKHLVVCLASSLLIGSSLASAQTAPPPGFGDETKGEPAVTEPEKKEPQATPGAQAKADDAEKEASTSPFGTATITENRRESGQIYLIELEHSLGSKQYIEENDSDGKIEPTDNDLEEAPNLPKWKLGSW